MKKLIKFEINKIIKSKTFVISTLILILMCYLIIFLNYKSKNYENEYKYIDEPNEIIEIENNRIYNYIEENNINNYDKLKYVMNTSLTTIMFLTFLTTLLSSKLLISEFDNGTIKNILTKPYKRWKIYLSKLIIALILVIFYTLVIYFSYVIFSSLIMKTNIFKIKEYFVSNNKIREISFIYTYSKNYFICSIPTIFLTLLSYNISFLFLNSYVGYIISLCLCVFGPTISNLLLAINYKIIKYTFLPYLDFNVLIDNLTLYYINNLYSIDLSINKGITILSVYLIMLTIISIIVFNKKDIKK